MSKQYSPKRFFRQVANAFLQQYFSARHVLADVNFKELTETNITPIYDAWLTLPENLRNTMEQDFQQIDEMATEAGSKAILDEANWHGENLAEQFALLNGFHDHAFWTFLERPSYWPSAIAFNYADSLPTSYWRKRKNLPDVAAHTDSANIQALEHNLRHYFYSKQGRGKNCKVEVYKRNNLDYFFAYPEDYAQASIEWEENKFSRRSHHPAFEIIFVYAQKEHTLDIYLSGDRKAVSNLQDIFAETILKTLLPLDAKDEKVYDLDCFRSRHFPFKYAPDSGIESVRIIKLRLTLFDPDGKITIEADPSINPHAIYDLLEKELRSALNPRLKITQVGIKVNFNPSAAGKRGKTRNFHMTWPNSCSLKYDEQSMIIRRMLADSGIEPQLPTARTAATPKVVALA